MSRDVTGDTKFLPVHNQFFSILMTKIYLKQLPIFCQVIILPKFT